MRNGRWENKLTVVLLLRDCKFLLPWKKSGSFFQEFASRRVLPDNFLFVATFDTFLWWLPYVNNALPIGRVLEVEGMLRG